MKKILAVALFVGVLFLSGCSDGKEGKLVCTMDQSIDSSTKLKSTYNVSYKGGYATMVETTETITSDNSEVLDSYKSSLDSMYGAYKNIEYYDNDIKVEDNQLVSTTKINYEKIDTDKLVEIDSNNKSIMENGKVKVSILKDAYEQLGASCKEK